MRLNSGYPPGGTPLGKQLSERRISAAKQRDDRLKRRGPVLLRRLPIMSESFDVEAQREALLRASKIDKRRPEHAVEHGVGLVDRLSPASKSMEQLLLLVEGTEDGALSPQNIDVAREAIRGLLDEDIQIQAKVLELILIERPRIALRGKDRGARSIECPQRMHQRRMLFDLSKVIEVVGILAQVDKMAIACGI